jgi:DNA-binding beta-propeller fold protein YncE
MRSFRTLWVVPLVALAASGCGTSPSLGAAKEISAERPVWPKPPDPPRIRYLRSVAGPEDLGVERSFWRRIIDFVSARGPGHFVRPTGVAEHDGVLYVADPGARALWILDPGRGRFVKLAQVGEQALVSPVAVAVRPDGAVFLADSGLKKVYLIDRAGRLLRIAAQAGLARPAGLAYDAARGRLYVADSANHRIDVYGPDGALLRRWGRSGNRDGEFNYPTYLALDASGNLLVTDALNFRVQAFDREGRFRWKLGRHGDGSGDFAAPKGVAADGEGRLYVVDALFDAVQIFGPDGKLLLGFGQQGTRAGQFWLPGGIFVASRDEIYVADAYNQRVQVFQRIPAAGEGVGK